MQSTIPGQKNIRRRAVEDSKGNMIFVGDTVRHNLNGSDAVVTSTHTACANGVRWNEVDIDGRTGPWATEDIRKIS
jgi:hypothetical protein